MSEKDKEGIYEPEDLEVNRNSKKSLIQHISHRLRHHKCIPHTDNGSLDRDHILEMARACLRYKYTIELNSNRTVIADCLKSVQSEALEERSIRLPFISKKTFYKAKTDPAQPGMSKEEYGRIIAAILDFPWEGDTHIGVQNKVVSRVFLESALDSLSAPGDSVGITKMESKDNFVKLGRPNIKVTKAKDLISRVMLPDQEDWSGVKWQETGIIIPTYQRHSNQWSKPKRTNLVDSILRDIPMPSIVLGRVNPSGPWQLIDGQQRLLVYLGFLELLHTYDGKRIDEWPDWARERFGDYRFNVEHITANSDSELAKIFERYNSSGKALNAAELRTARFHETSALHHYLMAMAGGPMMEGREQSQVRIGVAGDLEKHAGRTQYIRDKLPRKSDHVPEERKRIKRTTITIYDQLCKMVAYSIYRQTKPEVRGSKNDTPSGAVACKLILAAHHYGVEASTIADRLYHVIAKASAIYGHGDHGYAFKNLKYHGPNDETGEKGGWKPFGGTHAWVSQMHCASLWHRTSREFDLLEMNTDTVRTEWLKFATDPDIGFLEVRQNSNTIWEKQTIWSRRVDELLEDFADDLDTDSLLDPDAKDNIVSLLKTLSGLPEEAREGLLVALEDQLDSHVFEVLLKELGKRT